MHRAIAILLSTLMVSCLPSAPARAEGTGHPPAQEEKNFFASVILPILNNVKKAMPSAPSGWIVDGDAKIDPAPDITNSAMHYLRFTCTTTYKRVKGVREETKKLDDAYAESRRRHEDDARPRIDELINQQTEVSLALRKAARRRNQVQEKRLNDELEENGRKMRAIHEETDRKIAQDVEQFLVKDAEAAILVTLNDENAELLNGEPFYQPKAVFALRKEGGRSGATGWKEGRTLILFGEWQQTGQTVFRMKMGQPPFWPKVASIKITLIGDKRRVDELLNQMDLKAILSLMK